MNPDQLVKEGRQESKVNKEYLEDEDQLDLQVIVNFVMFLLNKQVEEIPKKGHNACLKYFFFY